MNRIVTSREELLAAAREIVMSEGAERLSIRYLAGRCNIATGSLYNYFSSKSELLFAVVEEFWKTVFHPNLCRLEEPTVFPDFLEAIYLRLHENLHEFEALFLSGLSMLRREDRSRGKKLEQSCFFHVKEGFLRGLKRDPRIRPQIWSEEFTPERFCDFLVSQMLVMLANGERDCGFLREVAGRLLYGGLPVQ